MKIQYKNYNLEKQKIGVNKSIKGLIIFLQYLKISSFTLLTK